LSGDPARAELGPGWYGGESVITPPHARGTGQ
jgi:hypothetical protein